MKRKFLFLLIRKNFMRKKILSILDIQNFFCIKKEYKIKKEIKEYELEENKKLDLEQFEVENPRINEIEEYLTNLRGKHFNIEEEKQSNEVKN